MVSPEKSSRNDGEKSTRPRLPCNDTATAALLDGGRRCGAGHGKHLREVNAINGVYCM